MLPIIGPLFKVVQTFFRWQTEKAVARHKRDMAAIESNTKALTEAQRSLSYWETAQLKDKDKLLRRFSFFLLTTPIIVAMFDPELVKYYFETALSSMPEWYVKLYVGIVGAIWGIHAASSSILALVNGLFKTNKDIVNK